MTAPRLEARYFADGTRQFDRLARVLRYTAGVHCQGWQVVVDELPRAPERGGTGVRNHLANTHKLAAWARIVAESQDGDRLLLMDADTWIQQPLDDLWARPFDLAYTTRAGWPVPFNLGVVALRVSARTRAFMADWLAENHRLFAGGGDADAWRRAYGGVNQASFANLLASGALRDLDILTLPCAEWNCEDSSWAQFDPDVTRIVHAKSALRLAALESQPIPDDLAALAALWRRLCREVDQLPRSA